MRRPSFVVILREGSRPHDRGFDDWCGFLAGCVDYYSHVFYFDMDSGHDPTHDLWADGREVWRNGEYLTEIVTERAVDFVGCRSSMRWA